MVFALGLVAFAGACRSSGEPHEPGSVATPAPSQVATPVIDAHLERRWSELGIRSPAPADDATYLRRVTLDLQNSLPDEDDVVAFLADRDPDKRAKLVDRLLGSAAFSERMALVYERLLLGPPVQTPALDRAAFRRYLVRAFADRTPWDQLTRDLITASGKSSLGGARRAPPAGDQATIAARERADGVNGAVNWLVRYGRTPQDLAGKTSGVFLGVQIQCAQCHDHVSEPITQADFQAFTAAFKHTRARRVSPPEPGRITELEIFDAARPAPLWRNDDDLRTIAKLEPTALDGTPLAGDAPPRAALAAWITKPDNPTFAKAFVNRAWYELLGSAFVEPVDDFGQSNPAREPELLDALASSFVESGFDVRHVYRLIALSKPYQAAASGSERTSEKARLFERFEPRPLSPDALLEALSAATEAPRMIQARGQGNPLVIKERMRQKLTFLFDEDAESNPDDSLGSIPQALFLLNGPATHRTTTVAAGGALDDVLQRPPSERLSALFLRTLTRYPTDVERARFEQLIAQSPSEARAYEDIFWALLNSTEFTFNH